MSKRYTLVERSYTNHCCFEYSILDKESDNEWENSTGGAVVAEFLEEIYARQVLALLNGEST